MPKIFLATCLAFPWLWAPPAAAHAMLVEALPAMGGTVVVAPSDLVLKFNERVQAVLSHVQVLDDSGKRFDTGDIRGSRSDPTELIVSLQPLASGNYKVIWRAVSVYTHVTTGSFAFHVGK